MPEIAQTADHALRILEELGEGSPLTATELCHRLGLNRTVVQRLLTTLAARGFVRRHGTRYGPGIALLRLAKLIEPDLREVVAPIMARVSADIGETVVVHVADGLQAVVLEQAVGTGHVVQVSHQIGSRHSLALAASGRAILAFLPANRIARVLASLDNPTTVQRNLEFITTSRYALSHDELQLGVHGLAVPLLDADGLAIGSLAVLVPTARARNLERFVEQLWAAAAEIDHQLADHSERYQQEIEDTSA